MKTNSDQFQFIICGKTGSHTLQINDKTKKVTSSATLLSFTIASKLNFSEHMDNIIQKACYKLYALRRKIQNINNFHDKVSLPTAQ